MYPDLSYILHALIGTEPDNAFSIVKTFGLFLLFTFVVAAYIVNLEIKRKEGLGLLKPQQKKITIGEAPQLKDFISPAIMGFLVGFKFLYIYNNFSEFQTDAAAVILSSKGSFIGGLLFMALNVGWKYYEINKEKLATPKVLSLDVWPHEKVGDFTIIAAISGVVGAKLFAIFETVDNLERFWEQLFSGAGMAIYGGLIVAFVACYLYWKAQKVNPIYIMDAVAPALMIGYGVGRIGCQLSGDGDWGIDNLAAMPSWWFFPDWLWAYDYPQNVLNKGVAIEGCEYLYCSKLVNPVWPTPIYETTLSFAFGAILWSIRKSIQIPGILFCIYLIMNGVERFFVEKIRVNDKLIDGVITATQAEIIAISLVLIGIIGIFTLKKNSKTKEI